MEGDPGQRAVDSVANRAADGAGGAGGAPAAIARLRSLLNQAPSPSAGELARAWRAERALISALPPRYGQVLEALLSRLESAAMFGEESCSFSAADLRGELTVWLTKAERTLE